MCDPKKEEVKMLGLTWEFLADFCMEDALKLNPKLKMMLYPLMIKSMASSSESHAPKWLIYTCSET